jgi:hypothetical protein
MNGEAIAEVMGNTYLVLVALLSLSALAAKIYIDFDKKKNNRNKTSINGRQR